MGRRLRLLLGINIFWLALSVLTDGVNTLVLPVRLGGLSGAAEQASVLGLFTFFGLAAAALIQPLAGAASDRLRPLFGRRGFIGVGVLITLAALALFGSARSLALVFIAYLVLQLAASLAQAGQQALLPDLVDQKRRGLASGIKGFMDLAGAMLGFVLLGRLLGSDEISPALAAIAGALVAGYLLAVVLTPEDRKSAAPAARPRLSLRDTFRVDFPGRAPFLRLIAARFLFLLGIYATGRFMLLFVAARLGLDPAQAAQKAGDLLALLALFTVLASPLAGWLADRTGRFPVMIAGALLGAAGALLLIWAGSYALILAFGALLSLGSAFFSAGSWALLADLVPKDESARYFGLANLSTAGAAAAAGLFGPLMDAAGRIAPGSGYSVLFMAAALAFLASILPMRRLINWKEVSHVQQGIADQGGPRTPRRGLAHLSLPAHPTAAEADQDPPRGPAGL